jgi:hypothetical protein
VGDELQTDATFDHDIIARMGTRFYDDVFVPAITAAGKRERRTRPSGTRFAKDGNRPARHRSNSTQRPASIVRGMVAVRCRDRRWAFPREEVHRSASLFVSSLACLISHFRLAGVSALAA